MKVYNSWSYWDEQRYVLGKYSEIEMENGSLMAY